MLLFQLKNVRNNHSSTSDSLEYTKSCSKKKTCSMLFYENGSKQRLRNLSEFKPMTENFLDKLHEEECKQSKGAKICASIIRELDCEKCSKTFCQIFARQNMQNQTNAKHSMPTLRTFLNQLKTF